MIKSLRINLLAQDAQILIGRLWRHGQWICRMTLHVSHSIGHSPRFAVEYGACLF
jgi:hypothetical protein